MKTKDKQSVADTLTEKAMWIRVGWLWFRARPLTLAQIFEMGAVANGIDAGDLNDTQRKIRVIASMVNHHKDAKLMIKIFIITLFRSRWARVLFGWYIRRKITVLKFQELLNYIAVSFNANFFLTSIIFLRQATVMTEPSPTTALGQQSEE